MVTHAFNPSAWETEAGGSLSSRIEATALLQSHFVCDTFTNRHILSSRFLKEARHTIPHGRQTSTSPIPGALQLPVQQQAMPFQKTGGGTPRRHLPCGCCTRRQPSSNCVSPHPQQRPYKCSLQTFPRERITNIHLPKIGHQ